MMRYILRRLWQMIPTLAGVILLTFLLFNVVGGSPASMALGKNASPSELEEFDEARGFNKPLIAGWWARTRALEGIDGQLATNPTPEGWVLRGTTTVPLRFPLRPETGYRWRLVYRLTGGQATFMIRQGADILQQVSLAVTPRWRSVEIDCRTGRATGDLTVALECRGDGVELRELQLRRRMPHVWDSQFVFYLNRLRQGDLGKSEATNQRVVRMLKEGVGPSLMLTVPIFFIELILSVSLALVCACFHNRWIDRTLVILAVALMSINYLVWIVAGQYVLAYRLGWFPIWGFESWRYLLLPIAVGVISGLGSNLRFYRTIMLDEIRREYVRTALAKGLAWRRILFVHVLKNAMIPILTNTVIAIPFLYTGSLLLESFFGIPGLGGMSINAINSADVDVIRAVVLVGTVLYLAANLLADLCNALVDPRVKLQ